MGLGEAAIRARIWQMAAGNVNGLGLCLRPEDVWVDEAGTLRGSVEDCVYLGGRFRLQVRVGADQVLPVYATKRARIGEAVGLVISDVRDLVRGWRQVNR